MEHAIFEVLERYHISEFPNAAELPEEDGEPLESSWHRNEINLLIDILRQTWQGRKDFYVSGHFTHQSIFAMIPTKTNCGGGG